MNAQADDARPHDLSTPTVDVLIPALNEAEALPHTLARLATRRRVISNIHWRQVVVVDNGSTDDTAEVARAMGARVVSEPRRGYGQACLSGIEAIALDPPDVLLFLDADGSDDLEDLGVMLSVFVEEGRERGELGEPDELNHRVRAVNYPIDRSSVPRAELVIGSRPRRAEAGALTPLQRFGNALSCTLILWLFGARFTDLGPLRAVSWSALRALEMADIDFGWTVEMQAKAAARGIRCVEVDVRYLPRYAGESKISGSIRGSYRAGVKIIATIVREWWRARRG